MQLRVSVELISLGLVVGNCKLELASCFRSMQVCVSMASDNCVPPISILRSVYVCVVVLGKFCW